MDRLRVLVTGASGFLGQRVVARLADEHLVYALVRQGSLLCGASPPRGADVVQGDLGSPDGLRDLPRQADCIIHLAQSREFRRFPEGMRDMVSVNIQGTYQLLEYARWAGVRHFIYASTGSLYADRSENVQAEDRDEGPVQAYPVTKYCGELLLRPYAEFFATLSLRLFFLYGPGQRDMLIAKLIDRIGCGEPVTLQGPGGGMELCPTYVDDVARVIAQAMRQRVVGVVNVASPERLTLLEVAGAIAERLGVEPQVLRDVEAIPAVFRPALDRLKGWYDLEKGFRPFEVGIAATLDHVHTRGSRAKLGDKGPVR
jgi:UDP-glucose 4-epimerase